MAEDLGKRIKDITSKMKYCGPRESAELAKELLSVVIEYRKESRSSFDKFFEETKDTIRQACSYIKDLERELDERRFTIKPCTGALPDEYDLKTIDAILDKDGYIRGCPRFLEEERECKVSDDVYAPCPYARNG